MKSQITFTVSFRGSLGKLLVLSTLAPLAVVCCAQSAEKKAEDQAATVIRRQIEIDEDAPNSMNPKGLRIHFSRIGDVQLPGGHVVRYRLRVPGAPEKQSYVLAVWRIGAPMSYFHSKVYTNAKGLLMQHPPLAEQENLDSLKRDDEIEVDLKAARGEPIRYMLASSDEKLFFPGAIVLHPAASKGGNCRLEARLAFPEGQAVLLYGDGLAPGLQIPMQIVSAGDTRTQMLTANKQGHAVAVVAPYVTGKSAGVLKMSVAATGCSASIEIPWGKGSYHPL